MAAYARLTMSAKVRTATMGTAEDNRWVSHACLMRTVTLSWLARHKLHGHLPQHVRDSGSMGIHARPTMIATQRHSVGTSIPPILTQTSKDASLNTLKRLGPTSDGGPQQTMSLIMLFLMASSANLAGLGTPTAQKQHSALKSLLLSPILVQKWKTPTFAQQSWTITTASTTLTEAIITSWRASVSAPSIKMKASVAILVSQRLWPLSSMWLCSIKTTTVTLSTETTWRHSSSVDWATVKPSKMRCSGKWGLKSGPVWTGSTSSTVLSSSTRIVIQTSNLAENLIILF